MILARAPMRALSSRWRTPPEGVDASQFLEQMKRGRETMAAFERYAREIGCTVGEGAMCDSIIVETDEQARKLADWWMEHV